MDKIYKENLKAIISKIDNEKEAEIFLESLLTVKEYKEIATRIEILKRLNRGETQRNIAKDLGVSVSTVTRGSKELQKHGEELIKILEKIEDGN